MAAHGETVGWFANETFKPRPGLGSFTGLTHGFTGGYFLPRLRRSKQTDLKFYLLNVILLNLTLGKKNLELFFRRY